MPGKWIHRLSEINLENRTALCASCGLVGIKQKGKSKTWRCRKRINKDTGKRQRRKKLGPWAYEKREDGLCEICGVFSKMCWDHDHSTGLFRGWLCRLCNMGLGCFKDDLIRLRIAMDYLEKERAAP